MSGMPVGVGDVGLVPAGTDEELGGPARVEVVAPVAGQERMSALDVLRGCALLGILVENITEFGLGQSNYLFPLTTMKPVFSGPHWLANTVLWFVRWVVAEGKTRALFSMVFGAGIILLTQRAEARGAAAKVADVYTRRNLWLVLFGLVHAYLIWEGDILFFYGTAALFLYPFRRLRAGTLIWIAGVVLALNAVGIDYQQVYQQAEIQRDAVQARKAYAEHGTVTLAERQMMDFGDRGQSRWRPSKRRMNRDIAAETAGYWSAQNNDVNKVIDAETTTAYFGWGDWVGMMLLGMALVKNGFLTGKLRTSTYLWSAVIGLGICWPLVFVGAWKSWVGHFDVIQTSYWMMVPYTVQRVPGVIGSAALILLVVRAGVLGWLMKAVAAVGQMSLSNYLLTSLSMRFLMAWGPTHWYGALDYYKLYWIVGCVWVVNLVWSPIWLRYFEFGPMEWVWRSLSYWKRQPMRRAGSRG